MSSVVSDPLIGSMVDSRYHVLERLAEGGMATVYLAVDTRLDREVALKVLRPHLAADPDFVARFRREARSAARLSHPNIVTVYDQGQDDGRPFLAMEFVPGSTLREVLDDEGALTPRAATDIIGSILQALGAAHTAGLIHRDVKPENVILREDGQIKVADFGLARTITSQTATSATGVVLGTAAYLSPEQVERGIADARSDVYAAGLVLFEMLTGTKAMAGDNPIQVAYQHVHGGVPALSERASGIPDVLEEVVRAATARDPDARPADAQAMAALVRTARRELSAAELDARPEGVERTAATTASTARLAVGVAGSSRSATTQALATTPPSAAPTGPVRRRRSAWPWVAVLLAALLAGGTTWYFVAGPGAPTTVPRLAGLAVADARAALTTAHLDGAVSEEFSETVRPGLVIDSDPTAGVELRRGDSVTLAVSKGPERYAVPRLAGLTQAKATEALAATNLRVGAVTSAYDEKVPKGTVLSSDPTEGTSLKRSAQVALVVSQGRKPIVLTDHTGEPADAVTKALTDAGLSVSASQQEWSDTVPQGAVISQTPASGTFFRGDKVTLVVSKGPQLFEVPDVVRKQKADAERILKAAGFEVKFEEGFGAFFQTVRSQNPPGGSMKPKGTVITLLIL